MKEWSPASNPEVVHLAPGTYFPNKLPLWDKEYFIPESPPVDLFMATDTQILLPPNSLLTVKVTAQ